MDCENHVRTFPRIKCLLTKRMDTSKLICKNLQTKPKVDFSEFSEENPVSFVISATILAAIRQ